VLSTFFTQLLHKNTDTQQNSQKAGGLWIRAHALDTLERYDFQIQKNLSCKACLGIDGLSIKPIPAFQQKFSHRLFEWRYIENKTIAIGSFEHHILQELRQALKKSGVRVAPPSPFNRHVLAAQYQPLGPLIDTIRFYIQANNGQCVFLCPSSKSHLRLT
jgi:hypothetical protein